MNTRPPHSLQAHQPVFPAEWESQAGGNAAWLRFRPDQLWRQVEDGHEAAATGCRVCVDPVDRVYCDLRTLVCLTASYLSVPSLCRLAVFLCLCVPRPHRGCSVLLSRALASIPLPFVWRPILFVCSLCRVCCHELGPLFPRV